MGLGTEVLQKLRSREVAENRWKELFRVSVEPDPNKAALELPPLAGTYRLTATSIVFHPAFPFEAGVRYRATGFAGPGREHQPVSSVLAIPASRKEPSTVLQQIYPTASALPENLLKFYLQFSGPMNRGHIYEHIHLLNEDGNQVELPFLEIDEELWTRDMTRLTLFLDPGRIKRGVRPLEEVGPALVEGQNYTLLIDAAWQDASGTPLKSSFRKPFRVTPADRDPPDPHQWKIDPPRPGTQDSLKVTFSEPMDHALALRMITVLDRNSKTVRGESTVADQERVWTFTPAERWSAGQFNVVVQTTIEDLAGNNIGRPFEVDLAGSPQATFTDRGITIPFEIPAL